MALILLSGAVAVFWLLKTSQKSQEYVKKYVAEELSDEVTSDEEMQEQNKE